MHVMPALLAKNLRCEPEVYIVCLAGGMILEAGDHDDGLNISSWEADRRYFHAAYLH